MSWLLPQALQDPQVERHLLADEGEIIIDEVHKHWIAYTPAVLVAGLGLVSSWVFLFTAVAVAWLPLLIAVGCFGWAGWRAAWVHLDRFVVTNMRVFRLKGVFARSLATMPLGRILDITVLRPLHGRLLGFGHFTFESAAQDQGLRHITYVPHPNERDLTIQRIVQQAGLRTSSSTGDQLGAGARPWQSPGAGTGPTPTYAPIRQSPEKPFEGTAAGADYGPSFD